MLRFILTGHDVDVQHVGSTSIPGMIARPIIDILVAVADYEAASEYVRSIDRIGYEYRGENSNLRQYYFTKGRPTGYHLYVVEKSGGTWKERIAFRDLLRGNSGIASAYADYKRHIARLFPSNLEAYQKKKGEYCRRVLVGSSTEQPALHVPPHDLFE